MGTVYKVQNNWVLDDYPQNNLNNECTESDEFDQRFYITISEFTPPQVLIIRKDKKYGVYSCSGSFGFGGPGRWFNPTEIPFPYDETKVSEIVYGFCYVAFRIGTKWGIIKVADGIYLANYEQDRDDYDGDEHALTRRKIVVPCNYDTLEEAGLQIGITDWNVPFE